MEAIFPWEIPGLGKKAFNKRNFGEKQELKRDDRDMAMSPAGDIAAW